MFSDWTAISAIVACIALAISITSMVYSLYPTRKRNIRIETVRVYCGNDKCKILLYVCNGSSLPISVNSLRVYLLGFEYIPDSAQPDFPINVLPYQSEKLTISFNKVDSLHVDSTVSHTAVLSTSRGELTRVLIIKNIIPV